MEIDFQFGKMKKVLGMDGGDDCLTKGIFLIPLNYILEKWLKY